MKPSASDRLLPRVIYALGLLLGLSLTIVAQETPAPRAPVPQSPPGAQPPLRLRAGELRANLPEHPLQKSLALQMRLVRRLGLTPEQETRLQAIYQQHAEEWREANRRIRQAQNALARVLMNDAPATPEALDQRSRAIGDAEANIARLVAQVWLEVRQVLTQEQLQRFRRLRTEQLQQLQLLKQQRRAAPEDTEAAPDDDNPPARPARRLGLRPNANPLRTPATPTPTLPAKKP